MTGQWWFSLLALAAVLPVLTGVSFALPVLLAPDTRAALAGYLIVLLVVAGAVSYAYAIFYIPAEPTFIDRQCLGPPYDTC